MKRKDFREQGAYGNVGCHALRVSDVKCQDLTLRRAAKRLSGRKTA